MTKELDGNKMKVIFHGINFTNNKAILIDKHVLRHVM